MVRSRELLAGLAPDNQIGVLAFRGVRRRNGSEFVVASLVALGSTKPRTRRGAARHRQRWSNLATAAIQLDARYTPMHRYGAITVRHAIATPSGRCALPKANPADS